MKYYMYDAEKKEESGPWTKEEVAGMLDCKPDVAGKYASTGHVYRKRFQFRPSQTELKRPRKQSWMFDMLKDWDVIRWKLLASGTDLKQIRLAKG